MTYPLTVVGFLIGRILLFAYARHEQITEQKIYIFSQARHWSIHERQKTGQFEAPHLSPVNSTTSADQLDLKKSNK